MTSHKLKNKIDYSNHNISFSSNLPARKHTIVATIRKRNVRWNNIFPSNNNWTNATLRKLRGKKCYFVCFNTRCGLRWKFECWLIIHWAKLKVQWECFWFCPQHLWIRCFVISSIIKKKTHWISVSFVETWMGKSFIEVKRRE